MSRITTLYELEDILNTLGTLFLFIKANYLGLHIFRDVFCLYNADNVGHGQSLFREKERICKLYSCNWLFCWQSHIRTTDNKTSQQLWLPWMYGVVGGDNVTWLYMWSFV